jgi:hypothetical protein
VQQASSSAWYFLELHHQQIPNQTIILAMKLRSSSRATVSCKRVSKGIQCHLHITFNTALALLLVDSIRVCKHTTVIRICKDATYITSMTFHPHNGFSKKKIF